MLLFISVSNSIKGQDTIKIKTDSISVHKHSPAKAALLSAALPGLGQIYNGKGVFYRLPILYAGIAVESYFIFTLNKSYNTYHNIYVNYNNYLQSLGGADPDTKKENSILSDIGGFKSYYTTPSVLNALKDNTNFYRHYRDLNIILMAGIYFLNIVDATVQAYFFDYDISDNLSLKAEPTIINTLTCKDVVGLKLTFNLH